MEKDAVGYPRGHKNPDVRRTSPAAYSTAARSGVPRIAPKTVHGWKLVAPSSRLRAYLSRPLVGCVKRTKFRPTRSDRNLAHYTNCVTPTGIENKISK